MLFAPDVLALISVLGTMLRSVGADVSWSWMYLSVVLMTSQVDIISLEPISPSPAEFSNPRGLFLRSVDSRLSSVYSDLIVNISITVCSLACLTKTPRSGGHSDGFPCKSFDYDNAGRTCYLFSVCQLDKDVRLIQSTGRDHYETAFVREFTRLPRHMLPGSSSLILSRLSVEECSRRCVTEMQFRCSGFNFRRNDGDDSGSPGYLGRSEGQGGRGGGQGTNMGGVSQCDLMAETLITSKVGIVNSDHVDFYQRLSDGPLLSFMNYGMGSLQPLVNNGSPFDRIIAEVTIDVCAQLCLNESSFHCQSFDFIYNPPSSPSNRSTLIQESSVVAACQLSRHSATSVGGFKVDRQRNHYERIGSNMNKFYVVPWAVLRSPTLQMQSPISMDTCALRCLTQTAFVCRSFDYTIQGGGGCILSSKTARDIGSLETQDVVRGDAFHFEMKPLLDCGGDLFESSGGLATPNWPDSYSSNEDCTWNIKVEPFKLVKLTITHFDLGSSVGFGCKETDDRLVIIEAGNKPYCVHADSKTIITKSNQVTIRFYSPEHMKNSGSKGFRIFYSADWPCGALLSALSSAQFASPLWPEPYPPGSRCTYRITAPADHLSVRIQFNSFDLNLHPLGHCTDKVDHIKLLDGGTASAPVIGQYCGQQNNLNVRSTWRDLVIRFFSDSNTQGLGTGFHATYWYEMQNGTIWNTAAVNNNVTIAAGEKSFDASKGVSPNGQSSTSSIDEVESELQKYQGSLLRNGSESDRSTGGLWGTVIILLLIVIALGVIIFFLVRRQRMRKFSSQSLRYNGDEMVPLQNEIPPTDHSHSNRRHNPQNKLSQQPFNNLVDLKPAHSDRPINEGPIGVSVPSVSEVTRLSNCAASCAEPCDPSVSKKSCASSCDPSESTPPHPVAPARTHRPVSTYGKYHADNLRNTNIDAKAADQQARLSPI